MQNGNSSLVINICELVFEDQTKGEKKKNTRPSSEISHVLNIFNYDLIQTSTPLQLRQVESAP